MATIRKRLGKYQAQIRKDGNFISQTFINKTDAIKWTKEQEVLIEQGCYISKKESVTLAFLLTRWEQEVLVHLKSFKVERYKVALVSRVLGQLTLNKITSAVLVDYRDNRLQEVFNQTIKHELGLIRRALKKVLNGDIHLLFLIKHHHHLKVRQEIEDYQKLKCHYY